MMAGGNNIPSSTKEYIQGKLNLAMSLIKSINQRQHTIYKVLESIVKFQREFLDNGMLRGTSLTYENFLELSSFLSATTTDTYMVLENSKAIDKTLEELDLRKQSGVTIIAIVRDGKAKTNPGADFRIKRGDALVLLGSHAELDKAINILGRVVV